MELLRCKARLSVLWLTMAVGTVSAMFLSLLAPDRIENVMAVAILCLTLSGSANRWMNFILGIIWVVWFIFEIVYHVTMIATVPIASWLMIIVGTVISVYIVYFAWKLPKQES